MGSLKLNPKARRFSAIAGGMLAISIALRLLVHPQSAGATSSMNFLTGLMIGCSLVLNIWAFTQLRKSNGTS